MWRDRDSETGVGGGDRDPERGEQRQRDGTEGTETQGEGMTW